MKITVVNGDRSVVIKVKGHSVKALKHAEATASRLLQAAPSPASTLDERPFGYAVTADAGLSYQDDESHHAM